MINRGSGREQTRKYLRGLLLKPLLHSTIYIVMIGIVVIVNSFGINIFPQVTTLELQILLL